MNPYVIVTGKVGRILPFVSERSLHLQFLPPLRSSLYVKHACSNLSFMYVCSSTYLSTYMNSIKLSVYSIIKHSDNQTSAMVLIDFVKKKREIYVQFR